MQRLLARVAAHSRGDDADTDLGTAAAFAACVQWIAQYYVEGPEAAREVHEEQKRFTGSGIEQKSFTGWGLGVTWEDGKRKRARPLLQGGWEARSIFANAAPTPAVLARGWLALELEPDRGQAPSPLSAEEVNHRERTSCEKM